MKAIVENSLCIGGFNDTVDLSLFVEFNKLLIVTTNAQSKEVLKHYMKLEFSNSVNFKYGFGASHMWVKQIVKGETCTNRLIIVEF